VGGTCYNPAIKQANMDDKQNDIEFIRDWCVTILEYMAAEYPANATDGAGHSYKEFFQRKTDRIKGFAQKNKASWKIFYNDINEFARETKNKVGLDNLLLERFGKTLKGVQKDIEKQVLKIQTRGRIISHHEFYLVKSYLDEVMDDIIKASELDLLLSKYEDSLNKN
jgi:hypothetical protein